MRALLIVSLVLCAAGCSLSGDGGGAVEPAELERLVLQQGDLSRAFIAFDVGRQGAADRPGREGSDLTRFGRQGGWKARYRRPGTAQTAGPLVVASLVDVFESTEGARDDYEATKEELRTASPAWSAVDSPQLGEESFAAKLEQGLASSRVVFFHVVWREKNVVASLEVNGFAGKVDLADTIELARKQAARIERAAGS